jgi:hypothetical protein
VSKTRTASNQLPVAHQVLKLLRRLVGVGALAGRRGREYQFDHVVEETAFRVDLAEHVDTSVRASCSVTSRLAKCGSVSNREPRPSYRLQMYAAEYHYARV